MKRSVPGLKLSPFISFGDRISDVKYSRVATFSGCEFSSLKPLGGFICDKDVRADFAQWTGHQCIRMCKAS